MKKNIFLLALALAMNLGNINAQNPKTTAGNAETTITAPAEAPTKATENAMRRINLQVSRLSDVVNLDAEQKKIIADIYIKSDAEGTELRKKLNELNKKRDEEVRQILSSEQQINLDASQAKIQNIKNTVVQPTRQVTTPESVPENPNSKPKLQKKQPNSK